MIYLIILLVVLICVFGYAFKQSYQADSESLIKWVPVVFLCGFLIVVDLIAMLIWWLVH